MVTKVVILSTITQNYRTLVFGINLISILQSSHLGESVLLLTVYGPMTPIDNDTQAESK